jgi:hypothetical protein
MNLSESDVPITRTNSATSFHLSPATLAIGSLQALEIPNASAYRYCSKNRDVAEYLEVHTTVVPALRRPALPTLLSRPSRTRRDDRGL